MKNYFCNLKVFVFVCLLLPSYVSPEIKHANITILNEGYVKPVEGRNFIPGEQDDGARSVASTVALIDVEDVLIIVDPGMVSSEVNLLEKIEDAGFTPTNVTHVFISHHHPDHTIRVGMFPQATVLDFWGSYKYDHWEDHGDMHEVAKGVWIMRTPGHTNEDASLVVESENGTYVFTHVWWNEKMEPKIDPLAEDQEKLVESRKKILDIADFIIPGHGRLFSNPKNQK